MADNSNQVSPDNEPQEQPPTVIEGSLSPAQLRRDPEAIRQAFETAAYPYQTRISTKTCEEEMKKLQVELLKVQYWIKERSERLVILFEGRDAAGKGGTIKRFVKHLNPRGARVVALEKPSERERTQW
jgi:polyphosphate kinase